MKLSIPLVICSSWLVTSASISSLHSQSNKILEQSVKAFAEADGCDEELKAADQMKWVGLMNNYRHCAEEIIFKELIYV